jgi:hypothetical protein
MRDRLEAALLHVTAALRALGPAPARSRRGRHTWRIARRSLEATATVLKVLQEAMAGRSARG